MDKSLISIILAIGFIGVFFIFYEKSRISSKEIPMLVVLASLAALGRVPFAILPGVQPTTFIVTISGFVFGPLAGFVVGAIAAVVSNMFLGQGPWTIWQMFAWSACGISCGILGKIRPAAGLKTLVPISFIWGFAFGWIMNFWYWLSFVYPLTIKSWLAVSAASFWFDTMHGTGNIVFMMIFGSSFIKILRHFKRKLVITYE